MPPTRLEPMLAAFHMSPEELAEKARQQARDDEGQFVEEADVKAELPEGMEPVGTAPVEGTETTTPPPPPEPLEEVSVRDLKPGDVFEHKGKRRVVSSNTPAFEDRDILSYEEGQPVWKSEKQSLPRDSTVMRVPPPPPPPEGNQEYALTAEDEALERRWMEPALEGRGSIGDLGDEERAEYKALVARRLEGRMRDIPTSALVSTVRQFFPVGQLPSVSVIDLESMEPVDLLSLKEAGTGGYHYMLHPDTGELLALAGWDGRSNIEFWDEQAHEEREYDPADVEIVNGGTRAAEQMARRWAVSELVKAWAHSSNDDHVGSLTTQEAVREQFGLEDAADWEKHTNTKPLPLEGDVGLVVNRFVNAMHAETQDLLERFGVAEMVLYRGAKAGSDEQLAAMVEDVDGYLALHERVLATGSRTSSNMLGNAHTRPASSWASSQRVAKDFAYTTTGTNVHEYTFVVKSTVPADRILATPLTGIGCSDEWEFVALGDAREVQIAPRHENDYRRDSFAAEPVDPRAGDVELDSDDTNADWIKQVGDWYEKEFGGPYEPEDEEATPAPPPTEGETMPAGDLLPDDVVTHNGQPVTVTGVVTGGDTTTVTGTTPDGETVEFDLPADETVPLGGPVSEPEPEPEPEPAPEPPSLSDLGMDPTKERRLRTTMKGKSLTLNEAKRDELEALRLEAYERIGQHYGWSPEQIEEAIATESKMIGHWITAGPEVDGTVLTMYPRIFAAVEALRTGKAPETADERAMTLMRSYAQMTLRERGEETVPLYRMVSGPQGKFLRTVGSGAPVDVQAHPLTSWAVEKGLPSLRSWLGNREGNSPNEGASLAVMRTEADASQVWMALWADERFRTTELKAKGEYIIDPGAGFTSENGLTVVDPHGRAPERVHDDDLTFLRQMFPDLTIADYAAAQSVSRIGGYRTEFGDEAAHAAGVIDSDLLESVSSVGALFKTLDGNPMVAVWALRDAGVDPETFRQFMRHGMMYRTVIGLGSGPEGSDSREFYLDRMARQRDTTQRALDVDPTMPDRLRESLEKVRYVEHDGRIVPLLPGETARASYNDVEVLGPDGEPVRHMTGYQNRMGGVQRWSDSRAVNIPLPARDWGERVREWDEAWVEAHGTPSPMQDLVTLTRSPDATRSDGYRIESHETSLKQVPDRWARALVEAGGRVEIFDGPVTAHPDMAPLRGQPLPGGSGTWDDVPGAHQGGVAYVGTQGESEASSVVLSELAHLFESQLGGLADDPQFIAALEAYLQKTGDRLSPRFMEPGGRREIFAEVFAAALGASSYRSPLPTHPMEFDLMVARLVELIEEKAGK